MISSHFKQLITSCKLNSQSLIKIQNRTMAGHNKWSKIKHKKGAKDLNRGREFTKATRAIRAAFRACGGDMENLQLQSAIQAAKALQIPKDRINDALRTKGDSSESDIFTIRYDGCLNTPSGKVNFIITSLTDNKNRTAGSVRNIIKKNGGEMLNTGANEWMFDHVGVVIVHKKKGYNASNEEANNSSGLGESIPFEGISLEEEEDLLECAIEGGASDVIFGDANDEYAMIQSPPSDLSTVVSQLRAENYYLLEFDTRYIIKSDVNGITSAIDLDEESSMKLENLLSKLNDDDDVNAIYHNANCVEVV